MNETGEKKSQPHLTAKELLTTRGICSQLIDEYNQVCRVLPKTGVKLFEPNGSWLQNKQIETCLGTRKDLIKVERVNRLSALAVAEWLPIEKKAMVTKKSGVEWNNYGNDVHGNLYLIPEEALLLVEMNCLELQYNGLALSIQQAYELLLDSPGEVCSLSEYRVFSQLARLGYRLQRFQYEKSTNERLEEMMQPKKKVVIDPENGRWMGKVSDVPPRMDSPIPIENSQPKKVQEDVRKIMNNIVDKIEGEESKEFVDKANESQNNEIKTKVKPRVEIVSEETVLDPVKLVVSPCNDVIGTSDSKIIKWSGARIQRNVKLLPKRMDKKVPSPSSTEPRKIITPLISVHSNNGVSTVEKRKLEMNSPQSYKMPKQEVIELSDDDIEEIPRKLTRMEMLNCIPNIASKDCIIQTVSRGYIPHSIKPQKSVYEYDRARISRIRETNRNRGSLSEASTSNHDNSNDHFFSGNSIVPYQKSPSLLISPLKENNSSQCIYQRNRGSLHGYRNFQHNLRPCHMEQRHYRGANSNTYSQNYMMNSHWNQYMSNSWSSFQVNVFRSIAMVGFALRSSVTQNNVHFNEVMCNTQQYHRGQDHRRQFGHTNSSSHNFHRSPSIARAVTMERSRTETLQSNNDMRYQASFVKMPAESWSELKRKWKESKTITIEDEDDKMDCSEVEVVQRNVQALVNPRNVKNFIQIYDRLRIIKPAQTKTVRRKKGEYKISYKVYSNTQHYRKSDPGTPLFHLVISRRTNNFLQPVDLNRLQQALDCPNLLFAYVTGASVSYMQAGVVTLPNLTDK